MAVISLGCGNKIEHELTTITDKPPVNLVNESNGLEALLIEEEEDDNIENNS